MQTLHKSRNICLRLVASRFTTLLRRLKKNLQRMDLINTGDAHPAGSVSAPHRPHLLLARSDFMLHLIRGPRDGGRVRIRTEFQEGGEGGAVSQGEGFIGIQSSP